jgi:hypothetical protein
VQRSGGSILLVCANWRTFLRAFSSAAVHDEGHYFARLLFNELMVENDEIRCQSGNLRTVECSEEKQTPSRHRTQCHNPDQLETCARSFLLVHVVSQVPRAGPTCSLSAGGIETNRLWGSSVLNVWSFLNDDSVNIQIYHIFKD